MTKGRDSESGRADTNGSGSTPAQRELQPREAIVTLAADGRMQGRDNIVRDIQDYFCALAPAERILSEELVANRRREFEIEEAEIKAAPSGPRS